MQTYINGILLDSRHKHLVHHLKEMETTTLLAVFAIVFPASSIGEYPSLTQQILY